MGSWSSPRLPIPLSPEHHLSVTRVSTDTGHRCLQRRIRAALSGDLYPYPPSSSPTTSLSPSSRGSIPPGPGDDAQRTGPGGLSRCSSRTPPPTAPTQSTDISFESLRPEWELSASPQGGSACISGVDRVIGIRSFSLPPSTFKTDTAPRGPCPPRRCRRHPLWLVVRTLCFLQEDSPQSHISALRGLPGHLAGERPGGAEGTVTCCGHRDRRAEPVRHRLSIWASFDVSLRHQPVAVGRTSRPLLPSANTLGPLPALGAEEAERRSRTRRPASPGPALICAAGGSIGNTVGGSLDTLCRARAATDPLSRPQSSLARRVHFHTWEVSAARRGMGKGTCIRASATHGGSKCAKICPNSEPPLDTVTHPGC